MLLTRLPLHSAPSKPLDEREHCESGLASHTGLTVQEWLSKDIKTSIRLIALGNNGQDTFQSVPTDLQLTIKKYKKKKSEKNGHVPPIDCIQRWEEPMSHQVLGLKTCVEA